MKVKPLGINSLNRKQVNKENRNKYKTDELLSNHHSVFVLRNDVYFKCKLNLPLNLKGMPCPSCGVIMVPFEEFNAKLTEKVLETSSEYSVKALSEFEENMHDLEYLCFEKIKSNSIKTPNKTLQAVLMDLRPESHKAFTKNHLVTISKIDNLSKQLPFSVREEAKMLVSKANDIIRKDNSAFSFNRNFFIKSISNITEKIQNEDLAEQIYKTATSLNNIENDSNIFIIKFSELNSTKIGRRLVSKSVMTKEHIRPINSLGGQNGIDAPKNIVLECAGCNNERENLPFLDWIMINPEIIENFQRYFDFIINKINMGEIQNYNIYKVIKTLMTESNGVLKINTSRLAKKRTKLIQYQKTSKFNEMVPILA